MNQIKESDNYREYFTFGDKKAWGSGPWVDEPDKIQWIDRRSGLDCLIVRNRVGALCGYVGVTESHPLFGIPYSGKFGEYSFDKDAGTLGVTYVPGSREDIDHDHSPEGVVEVHGGLTFSGLCSESSDPEWDVESQGICHVPAEGRPDKVWWFGFDCAHAGDVSPKMEADLEKMYKEKGEERPKVPYPWAGEAYRDFPYVVAQVEKLAVQLFDLQHGANNATGNLRQEQSQAEGQGQDNSEGSGTAAGDASSEAEVLPGAQQEA